jgi:hypothetical protein
MDHESTTGVRYAPNFLYIGTSKAGSTWLFNALALHPDVYLASDKGLYYFDHHHENGDPWYLERFAGAQKQTARGEISHSYLSSPETPRRIAAFNPDMRLLVCLREPAERAFSDYLDLVKNQQYAGSFEAALDEVPRLRDRGRYATHLRRYFEAFPVNQLHIGLFDDLKEDAQRYADGVFEFLGVEPLTLSTAALAHRMPAGKPRSARLALMAKSASRQTKRAGLHRLRSRVKRSVLVRQMLYRPFASDRPVMEAATEERLRAEFAEEVEALDAMLGRPISRRWRYRAVQPGPHPTNA